MIVTVGTRGLTTKLRVYVASAVPNLEQVMTNVCVPAGIAERSSDPPLAVLAPDQKFDAVQEVGEPVVVQVRVVEFAGRVIGEAGEAVRLTVMPPTAVIVVDLESEAVTPALF